MGTTWVLPCTPVGVTVGGAISAQLALRDEQPSA